MCVGSARDWRQGKTRVRKKIVSACRGVGGGGGVVFSPTEERETNKEMKSPQA